MTKYQNYSNLDNYQKQQIIQELYVNNKLSFSDIAVKLNTYANKIRRDAISFDIPIRNKSDAQKNALITGKHSHPTKGKKRDDFTKNKIGLGVMNSWSNLTEQQLTDRKDKAKENWNNLSDDKKNEMLKLANRAVRETSKIGSKLEQYLLNRLLSDGIRTEFHKEQVLSNTKLQIDLFLTTIATALEIDGPSHFVPVWGNDALQRNIKYDNKKQGLIVGKGWNLIRIKQTKDFSQTRAELIYLKLKELYDTIITDKKQTGQIFIIEDNQL